MSNSTDFFSRGNRNIVRANVSIVGVRTLLQHAFSDDAIPLEKREKQGVAGRDPTEWRRSMLVTDDKQLYIPDRYVFTSLRNAAVRTRKGRGSIQSDVEATLQVEPAIILLSVYLPDNPRFSPPAPPTDPVYVDVRRVSNPNSKGSNIRYRVAASPGWECCFTLEWDKTIVPRELMRTVLRDAGTYHGLGDGLRIGMGRFVVTEYEEVQGAEEEITKGTVGQEEGNGMESGRKKVRPLRKTPETDGVSH